MKKLKRHLLTEEIYSIVKEEIMNRSLVPGEKVNIDQLARELQVSNIPVREALSRLAAEGLVKTVPFKGMFVMHMSLQELDEIFELRIELESLAVRKSVKEMGEQELQKLYDHMLQWKSAKLDTLDEKLSYVHLMNEGLHGLILKHCGNEMLMQLVKMYIERINRYLTLLNPEMHLQLVEQEWEEHWDVILALKKRNVEQSVEKMQIHLRQSHLRNRELILQKDHPLLDPF
ncbi:GntR family transcriptional regulator [Paenibacillus filicis]|uniref:GntR family transcriptional regulator n=1 Tax=Paenibacillus gyeongsangnamensis TaxID=3388067 RepID=A0ABT4QEQ3_9BACL|nr:GntR family transcriptional regulator [Paenibacillus filicis]MCZ8515241.1 GntR family transcriptional regulator [Paenibacillus filicis]